MEKNQQGALKLKAPQEGQDRVWRQEQGGDRVCAIPAILDRLSDQTDDQAVGPRKGRRDGPS
jgi:hypothetical protein